MTPYDKGLNTNKKIRGAMERLDQVEQSIGGLMGLLEREFGALSNQVSQLVDVVNTVVEVVGLEEVQKRQVEKAVAKLDAEDAELKKGLDQGLIKVADEVGPNSIVGYKEWDAAGQVRSPGKYFKNLGTLGAEAKKILVGQKLGFVSTIGNGGKIELTEIYEIDPEAAAKRAEAIAAEAAVKTLEEEAPVEVGTV